MHSTTDRGGSVVRSDITRTVQSTQLGPHSAGARDDVIRPQVLLVDDSLERSTIARSLQQRGYRVTTAATFEQATAIFAIAPPDVLVTEIRLGAFNGLHLIVRSRSRNPDVVAVVYTAFPDLVLEAETKRLNAAYLVRSADPSELLTTIARTSGTKPERRRSPRQQTTDVEVTLGDIHATVVDVSAKGVRLRLGDSTLPSTLQIRAPSLGISCRGTVVWLRRTTAMPETFLCGVEVMESTEGGGWPWRRLLHPDPRP